jgi:hypothetical protein
MNLRRSIRWLLSWIDLDGCETISVLGRLPRNWDSQALFSQLRGAIWAHEHPRLLNARQFSKHRVGVLYIGIGQEGHGFVLHDATPEGAEYLTSDWWGGFDRQLVILAYSCHSARLLRESRTQTYITHAVAYSDAVWLPDDTGEYWAGFLHKLLKTLRLSDGEANELYTSIQETYITAIRDRRSTLSYLGKMCLVQQSTKLDLVHGNHL